MARYEILSTPHNELDSIPSPLLSLPSPPRTLYYRGNLALLESTPKIAIVGSRKPNPYTKSLVATLASKIARRGGVVVSGGALGVDIIAHTNALPRTIMFSPASLEILYPRSNAPTIARMMNESLVLSEYERAYMPHRFSFLERNRLVVGLSEAVIIPQADLYSGSMQSARIALELQKPLFVLPHRLGESEGTNALLAQGKARAIYDVDEFLSLFFSEVRAEPEDELLRFCAGGVGFEEAYARFGERVLEYELEGRLVRENGRLRCV